MGKRPIPQGKDLDAVNGKIELPFISPYRKQIFSGDAGYHRWAVRKGYESRLRALQHPQDPGLTFTSEGKAIMTAYPLEAEGQTILISLAAQLNPDPHLDIGIFNGVGRARSDQQRIGLGNRNNQSFTLQGHSSHRKFAEIPAPIDLKIILEKQFT